MHSHTEGHSAELTASPDQKITQHFIGEAYAHCAAARGRQHQKTQQCSALCDQQRAKDTGQTLSIHLSVTFLSMAPVSHPDVRLKENMTLADRLYNLLLIQEFCKDNLNDCCHFTLEDMLYASSTIKVLQHARCVSCIPHPHVFFILSFS